MLPRSTALKNREANDLPNFPTFAKGGICRCDANPAARHLSAAPDANNYRSTAHRAVCFFPIMRSIPPHILFFIKTIPFQ